MKETSPPLNGLLESLVKVSEGEMREALKAAISALDAIDRSAGVSTAGFIAMRRQVRSALLKCQEALKAEEKKDG